MTSNGKLIYDLICRFRSHMTAEQIYQKLQGSSSKMSLATVYNNLNALEKEGILRRLSLDNQPDRFDLTERHDHLICTGCGSITDLNLSDLTELLAGQVPVSIDSYDLKLFYLCEKCAEKRNREKESEC